MTRLLSALVALVLVAAPPTAATAQTPQTNAPPGNSAIDEYLETVPGATGDQRPGTPAAGAGGGGVLPPAERARLEKLGPDGKALADAVDATAPPAAKPGEKILSGSAEGGSPVSAVLEAVTGSDGGGGMGVLLPVILLASLLGVIALAVLRRRSVS
jgi:hypothetical protein